MAHLQEDIHLPMGNDAIVPGHVPSANHEEWMPPSLRGCREFTNQPPDRVTGGNSTHGFHYMCHEWWSTGDLLARRLTLRFGVKPRYTKFLPLSLVESSEMVLDQCQCWDFSCSCLGSDGSTCKVHLIIHICVDTNDGQSVSQSMRELNPMQDRARNE